MTLHKTIEITRRFIIGMLIGVAAIFVFMLIFRVGVMIKNIISPPKVVPANHLYGVLPALSFPQKAVNQNFTYELNTVSGELPKFPDRINIYPIFKPQPGLLDLNKAKEKIKKLGFVNDSGGSLPENLLTEDRYSWVENTDYRRGIDFNIVTSDFVLESGFLSSSEILNTKQPPDKDTAITKVKDFLNLLAISADYIDFSKTGVEFFSINNGALVPEKNITKAKITRIDLQQKNIEYDLDTGIPDLAGGFKKTGMNLPIVYPNPPFTTITFWLAAIDKPIVKANFWYKIPDLKASPIPATYYIKSPSEAFEELKNGKAYIASYTGDLKNITISNAYLAYYIDETSNDYLMPVVVLEGNNDFIAYVSAVKTEWVK